MDNTYSIQLNGLRFYAYHGVEPQERIVGAYYNIDIELFADLRTSMVSDSISDTINYAEVTDIIGKIMNQPYNLLERVAGIIVEEIFNHFPSISAVRLTLCKENPPIGVHCHSACVKLFCNK